MIEALSTIVIWLVYAIGIVGVLAVFGLGGAVAHAAYAELTKGKPEPEADPYAEEDREDEEPTVVKWRGFRQDRGGPR